MLAAGAGLAIAFQTFEAAVPTPKILAWWPGISRDRELTHANL
jgi:hypothetical protein